MNHRNLLLALAFASWGLVSSAADQSPKLDTRVAPPPRNPLLDFKFTNEVGQPVTLSDFPGQALGITFFFTRCPLPNYCPRLSKNFQEASIKLASIPNAPTNWHFLSITIDPEHDTSEALLRYAKAYRYDPLHWSFLTGPVKQVNELARQCGMTVSDENGTLNHNFRTLIIDASGTLQTEIPFGGDLSSLITDEMLKACNATNQNQPKSVSLAR